VALSQGLLQVEFDAATVCEALSHDFEQSEAAETLVVQAWLLAFTSVEEQQFLPSLKAAGMAMGKEASTVVKPAFEQAVAHLSAQEALAWEVQAVVSAEATASSLAPVSGQHPPDLASLEAATVVLVFAESQPTTEQSDLPLNVV
jgi:hypothetical protein